ncbi:hypothetical protein GCM10029978_061270 [Actinoallomurus acanthiterrae]
MSHATTPGDKRAAYPEAVEQAHADFVARLAGSARARRGRRAARPPQAGVSMTPSGSADRGKGRREAAETRSSTVRQDADYIAGSPFYGPL